MPFAYRLCNAAWAPSTPDRARNIAGSRAALYGSHWNSRGVHTIYTSSSIALAILEILVQDTPVLPDGYQCWKVFLPDAQLAEVRLEDLPANWRTRPYPPKIQRLGDLWLKTSAATAVPSAVVRQERNYILNPRHPDYFADRWEQIADFEFYSRLPWQK